MNDVPPIDERFGKTADIVCGMMRYQLSPREQQVAWLYISGMPFRQMGAALGISANTVSAYLDRVMEKVDPHSVLPRGRIVLLRVLMGQPANAVHASLHQHAA